MLLVALRGAEKRVGKDQGRNATHSLRLGGAAAMWHDGVDQQSRKSGRWTAHGELDAKDLYNIIRKPYRPSSLLSQAADLDCAVRARSPARAGGADKVRQPLTNTERQIGSFSFFNHRHDLHLNG